MSIRYHHNVRHTMMRLRMLQKIHPVLISALAFAGVFLFLVQTLPGIQTVKIDLELDHPDHIKVYHANSGPFTEKKSSAPHAVQSFRTEVRIDLGGSFPNRMRIDLGDRNGSAKLFEIKIVSHFDRPLILGPAQILERFTMDKPDVSMTLEGDHVAVASFADDPYIVSRDRLFPRKYGFVSGASFLFAIVLWMILRTPAPQRQAPSGAPHATPVKVAAPDHLDALDGLRGLAAILVIADHTWDGFKGTGASAVWIFFALSGFLLARPFIEDPGRVASLDYMSGYFSRRFKRIVPIYYVYIVVVFIFSKRFGLGLMHALFLEGDGHLWAIPQEILFYIALPASMLPFHFLLKKIPWMIPVSIFFTLVAWNRYVGTNVIWLLGMDHIRLELFFGVFLSGVLFSHVHAARSKFMPDPSLFSKIAKPLASFLGSAIILFFLTFSTGSILGENVVYAQKYYGWYGFLAGFLVLCVVLSKDRFLNKILTFKPFRAIGVMGLSIYLFHPIVKILVEDVFLSLLNAKPRNFALFLSTLTVSYLLSTYTYANMEKPSWSINPFRLPSRSR